MKLRKLGGHQTEVEINPNFKVLFSYEKPVACYFKAPATHGGYARVDRKGPIDTEQHIHEWLGDNKASIMPQEFFDNLVRLDQIVL